MKKHIKVRAKLHKDEKHFDLEVLEMSPEKGMGNHFLGFDCSAFLFEGIGLGYNQATFKVTYGKRTDWRFKEPCELLVGLLERETVTNIEVKWWPRIKAAIEAYNEYEFEE